MLRISPNEWEPEGEGQSVTLVHSFWYITGALTLQGNTALPQRYCNLKNVYFSSLRVDVSCCTHRIAFYLMFASNWLNPEAK